MRILVVDDEPAVREALGRILRLEGFDVAMASDGRQAVRSQATAAADAVLLDVLMPALDGLEGLPAPARHGRSDRTPVLIGAAAGLYPAARAARLSPTEALRGA